LLSLRGAAAEESPADRVSSDPITESTRSEGIRQALHDLGYVEGQNIAFEYRYAEGKLDRFPELAAELVRLKVDIIVVAGGNTLIRAAKNATKTISIVMAGAAPDPVEAGLVESLARPGGNLTGITLLTRKLDGKRWSCSKKSLRRLPVSRFSTIRLFRPISWS
jgi:ABC transporter substrate binding protein